MIYLAMNKLHQEDTFIPIIEPIRIRMVVGSPREAATFLYREKEAWLNPNEEWDLLEIDEENLTVRKVNIPGLKFEGVVR